MRFKWNESHKKISKVAIATAAFLSMVNINVYPTTHSKYIDEGTLTYSATIHPLYKGDVNLTLLGKGPNTSEPPSNNYMSTYKYAYFRFSFDRNNVAIGDVVDTYEMLIEPSGACEIVSASTHGTKDKETNPTKITYTSSGTDRSEIIMRCDVGKISTIDQNIKVKVQIEETIGEGESAKVIPNYRSQEYTKTLAEYNAYHQSEIKVMWDENSLDLPEHITDEFFEQLRLKTLPENLQQYVNDFDYDSKIKDLSIPEKEKLYLIFRSVWLEHIVGNSTSYKDYFAEIVNYVTSSAYPDGESIFNLSNINQQNVLLPGFKVERTGTTGNYMYHYSFTKNAVGYARNAYNDVAKSNAMYFSTDDSTEINNAFNYYLQTYDYLNGQIKSSTANYNLLMEYINSYTPNNNGIAYILKNATIVTNPTEGQIKGQIIINGKVVNGLLYYKDDGRLVLDPNLLTIASNWKNNRVEIPFGDNMYNLFLTGLQSVYGDILPSSTIDWLKNNQSEIGNSVLKQEEHTDTFVFQNDDGSFSLFTIHADVSQKKTYVTVSPLHSSYVDGRFIFDITEENGDALEAVKALDAYFEYNVHNSLSHDTYIVDLSQSGTNVTYSTPYPNVSILHSEDMLASLGSGLKEIYSSVLSTTAIDQILSSTDSNSKAIRDFVSSKTLGEKVFVIEDNSKYVQINVYCDGQKTYVTAKNLNSTVANNKLSITLNSKNEAELLQIVQALDSCLDVADFASPLHTSTPLTNDMYIKVTRDGNGTTVTYSVDMNRVKIPFNSNEDTMYQTFINGLQPKYSFVTNEMITKLNDTSNEKIAAIKASVVKNSTSNSVYSDYFVNYDDGYYLLFNIYSDGKATYATVSRMLTNIVGNTLRFTINESDSANQLKIVQALDNYTGYAVHNSLQEDTKVVDIVVNSNSVTYSTFIKKISINFASSNSMVGLLIAGLRNDFNDIVLNDTVMNDFMSYYSSSSIVSSEADLIIKSVIKNNTSSTPVIYEDVLDYTQSDGSVLTFTICSDGIKTYVTIVEKSEASSVSVASLEKFSAEVVQKKSLKEKEYVKEEVSLEDAEPTDQTVKTEIKQDVPEVSAETSIEKEDNIVTSQHESKENISDESNTPNSAPSVDTGPPDGGAADTVQPVSNDVTLEETISVAITDVLVIDDA